MNSESVTPLAEAERLAAEAGLVGEELKDAAIVEGSVGLEEVLYQYREVILDLAGRVLLLEQAMQDRPVFAQTVRGKRTGH